MKKLMFAIGLPVALAACGETAGPVPVSFLSEAGAQLNSSEFGKSTANNAGVMTGEISYAQVLDERFAAEVPTMITFAFDSAVLDSAAQVTLDKQAQWILQFPEVRFRVYGHTDAVGSSAYNKSLGQRRANVAVDHLVSRGISRSRLEAAVSFGETRPLIPTADRERQNRRTVTQVTGFVGRHPTVLDGKYAQIVNREYLKSAEPKSTLTRRQRSGFKTQ